MHEMLNFMNFARVKRGIDLQKCEVSPKPQHCTWFAKKFADVDNFWYSFDHFGTLFGTRQRVGTLLKTGSRPQNKTLTIIQDPGNTRYEIFDRKSTQENVTFYLVSYNNIHF